SNQNAAILHSSDGRTWNVVHKTASAMTLGAVYWDADRYLIGGSYGLLLESKDGRTWRELPKIAPEKHYAAFASGGGITILVESNGGIYASASPVFSTAPTPVVATPPSPPPPMPNLPAAGSGQPIVLLKEGFENLPVPTGRPAGWSVRNLADPNDQRVWEVYPEEGKSRSGTQYIRAVLPQDKWLMTPPLSLPTTGSGSLVLWARSEDALALESLNAYVLTGGAEPFAYAPVLGKETGIPTTYKRFEYSLNAFAGQTIWLAFQAGGPGKHYILDLDDISVEWFGAGEAAPTGAPIPVTIYWHMADAADLYLNGQPLRTYSPDFKSRGDEAPQPAFTAQASIKTGDVFTVGTRRGGSGG
ncbi:MAG: choice-of-anchor J domain-containing protein, partial [Spirochaetaceae bacterium]|nr:choice-of-anchor J domain-containing protein [Spirochaetaceae bacterium]